MRDRCRRKGIRMGAIDALIGQLCIRLDLILLGSESNFRHAGWPPICRPLGERDFELIFRLE